MRSLRLVCLVVGSALVASTGTLVVAPAPAIAATGEAPVPTRPFAVHEALDATSDHTDPAWLHPAVTLPPVATVDVDVPASGWVRAGSLPVYVAAPSAGLTPTRVRVRMLSQPEVVAGGGRLLGFELSRSDGGSANAAVAVSVDYAGIAQAYGGDFASRLRLVRLLDCPCPLPSVAATNDPSRQRLDASTVPVASDPLAPLPPGENTGTAPDPDSGLGPQIPIGPTWDLVTGEVEKVTGSWLTAGSRSVYGTTAGPSGPNGDYRASVTGSDSWNVGVGSGAFTYSYPIDVPPAVAGPAPALSLDYNSPAVDGRSSSANGQAPKTGEGWSFEPGYIERKFHSCRDENLSQDDLCWSAQNEYVLHFGGQSAEIVRSGGASNEWRLRGSDPGWRILSFTACCPNQDNDGEYFVLITPDGTKYWFGYGIEPRNSPTLATNSAFEVPVYGGTGEPCAGSWCNQAYRWNVDRILDTNDNVTSLFYTKEYNYYARQGNATQPTRYVRSGYLSRIEYGQRNNAENGTAYGRVLVSAMDRCTAQVSCPAPTATSNPGDYPDVPLDLMCGSSSCVAANSTPTFWSTKEITSVSTSYWNAAAATPAYEPVASYTMTYSFPATGDGTTPSLWLKDVTKTGQYGAGSVALPGLRMTGVNLQNRVNTGTGVPGLNKYRVATVSTDLGARVYVTYGIAHPCPTAPASPAWDTNPYDCYPAWYDPHDGVNQAGWVPFRKYLVTNVNEVDMRGGQPDRTTGYTYNGAPAWHYRDSLLASLQSWDDYRGYSSVRVQVAGGGSSEGTDTRYLLFRGMQGDKLTSGGSKGDTVTDSSGATYNDFHYRAGLPLEVSRVDPTGGTFATTLYRYWAATTVDGPDGWQSHNAQYVRASQTIERTKNLDTGAWRDHQTDLTYATQSALPTTTSDAAMPGVAADDTCTKLDYTNHVTSGTAGNDTDWMVDRPYATTTYAGACATNGTSVLARTEYSYDGHAFMATPTNGNVTQHLSFTDSTHKVIDKTTYDALGRVATTISPNEVAAGTNGATTTTYSPATGYPYNGITTTTPKSTLLIGAPTLSTTTVPYPAFGTPAQTTDANGNVTKIGVDPLGRTTSVTRPDDAPGTPSVTFAYDIAAGAPNRITTRRLLSGTSYVTTYDYVDGLGREIETQQRDANDSGSDRRLTLTRYDSLGQQAAVSQTFGGDGAPGSNLATVALTDIPNETRYGYDSAGRVTLATQYAAGVAKFSTRTTYRGTSYTVDAPVHSDVTYSVDTAGRTTQVVEQGDQGSITTNYGYTPLGDLATVTDDAGHLTSYGYDWLHRRTSTSDPDTGGWSSTYDDEGDVLTTTDAKPEKVTYVYDRWRRRTDTYADTTSGTLLAHWTYDTAPDGSTIANAKGRLTAATTYADGMNYSTSYAVTGYDARGRATGKRWSLPSTAGALAGSYGYGYHYNASDMLTATDYPAAGGLAAETVSSGLNQAGLPVSLTTSLDAAHPYVAATTFDRAGRLASRSLAGGVTRNVTYDTTAGRLATLRTTAPVGGTTATIEDLTYGYDDDSNVVSVDDTIAGNGGTAQRECFGYDPLDRLTTAKTVTATTSCSTASRTAVFGADPYDLAWSYDDLGDLTTRTETQGLLTTGYAYAYAKPGHAHAASSVTRSVTDHTGEVPSTTTYPATLYDYDENGATTIRPDAGATGLTWNRLHQLTATTGTTATSNVYDADGTRLLRTSGSTTTLYLDGMELAATGSAVTATRYYGPAMRTASGVTVLLHNHQHSTSAAYNVTAQTVAYQRYTPYGSRRGSTPLAATEHRFLDKTEDPTGLDAVGARYYDPTLARFVSADPVVTPGRPISLAAYTYGNANPATFSDPSGLAAVTGDGVGGSCTLTNGACPPTTPTPTLTSAPNAPGGALAGAPSPTPTTRPSPTPGSGDGPDLSFITAIVKGGYRAYRTALPFLPGGQQAGALIDHGVGCGKGGKGSCGLFYVDLVSVGLPIASALRGATVAAEITADTATTSAAEAGSGKATTLYRAVGQQEADDIAASGGYRNPLGQEGKYFFPTREQAELYGQMMNKAPGFGAPNYLTSGSIPTSALSFAEAIEAGSEGPGLFFRGDPSAFFDVYNHGLIP
jgi:RHS repeat-associated protein